MARRRKAIARAEASDAHWSPEANPALREILDHIARQLAEEYTLLVGEAANKDGWYRSTNKEADE
jgi:ribosomal protein L31E